MDCRWLGRAWRVRLGLAPRRLPKSRVRIEWLVLTRKRKRSSHRIARSWTRATVTTSSSSWTTSRCQRSCQSPHLDRADLRASRSRPLDFVVRSCHASTVGAQRPNRNRQAQTGPRRLVRRSPTAASQSDCPSRLRAIATPLADSVVASPSSASAHAPAGRSR